MIRRETFQWVQHPCYNHYIAILLWWPDLPYLHWLSLITNTCTVLQDLAIEKNVLCTGIANWLSKSKLHWCNICSPLSCVSLFASFRVTEDKQKGLVKYWVVCEMPKQDIQVEVVQAHCPTSSTSFHILCLPGHYTSYDGFHDHLEGCPATNDCWFGLIWSLWNIIRWGVVLRTIVRPHYTTSPMHV